MRFGNTFTRIRGGMVAMLVLGLILDLVLFFIAGSAHEPAHEWLVLLVCPLALAGIFSIAVSPTLLFSIHLEGGRVRHMLLDRYVLNDFSAKDFDYIQIGGTFGYLFARATGLDDRKPPKDHPDLSPSQVEKARLRDVFIHFKHGRCIRIYGAHLRVLLALKDALERARAEQA